VQDKLNEYIKIKKELEEKLQELGTQGVVVPFFTELFQKYPIVSAIRWTQYAPHFNDGDACTFSVHDPAARVLATEDTAGDAEEEDEWLYAWDKSPDDTTGRSEAAQETGQFFSAIGDELMERVFGDGVQVTVTRNLDIEVEDYDHD
jgi:hypothetical protein